MRREQKAAAEADVTEARVVQELARIGFADVRELFDVNGQLKDPLALSDAMAAAVVSIEVTKQRTRRGEETTTEEFLTKVRTADKIGALSLLCRKLGLLKDKVDVTGRLDVASIVEASWKVKPGA